eukprot:PhF_6_TR29040/c0_g1_i1/m.42280
MSSTDSVTPPRVRTSVFFWFHKHVPSCCKTMEVSDPSRATTPDKVPEAFINTWMKTTNLKRPVPLDIATVSSIHTSSHTSPLTPRTPLDTSCETVATNSVSMFSLIPLTERNLEKHKNQVSV